MVVTDPNVPGKLESLFARPRKAPRGLGGVLVNKTYKFQVGCLHIKIADHAMEIIKTRQSD